MYKIRKTHFVKPPIQKGVSGGKAYGTGKRNQYSEKIMFRFRMGSDEGSFPTSVSLRKNVVSLWIVLMDKIDDDPHQVVQEFIEKVCVKRWKGQTAKGMSDFITKCMIHSILEKEDYEAWKKVYLSL